MKLTPIKVVKQSKMHLKEIKLFWHWFSQHRSELMPTNLTDVFITELEIQLFSICQLDWEIGPGISRENLFVLSPKGDRQLLKITRAIIAQSPPLSEWEFYYAKPPRQWNLRFDLDIKNTQVEINGSLWEFVLHRNENRTYDLIFKPNKFEGFSFDELYWAATIIVDGEIGEENRMQLIRKMEIVKSWHKNTKSVTQLQHGILSSLLKLGAGTKMNSTRQL